MGIPRAGSRSAQSPGIPRADNRRGALSMLGGYTSSQTAGYSLLSHYTSSATRHQVARTREKAWCRQHPYHLYLSSVTCRCLSGSVETCSCQAVEKPSQLSTLFSRVRGFAKERNVVGKKVLADIHCSGKQCTVIPHGFRVRAKLPA